MRRHLQRYLPVVLLALLVQILAPVAVAWAAAAAMSDPLGTAEICHSDPSTLTIKDNQGTDHDQHGGGCWICFAAQTSASFDAPRLLAFAVPYRQAARVTWSEHAALLRAPSSGTHAQARAPPAFS